MNDLYEQLAKINNELEGAPHEPCTLKVPDWAYPSLMRAVERVGYKVTMPLEPIKTGLQRRRSLLRR